MLGITNETRVFLKTGMTDGRLGYEGLRGLVSKDIREDVRGGHLFVFCNRRANRVKLLWYHDGGFYVVAKRLETLRRSKSASSTSTWRPSLASATARLIVTVVRPVLRSALVIARTFGDSRPLGLWPSGARFMGLVKIISPFYAFLKPTSLHLGTLE
jgi:hypothetical protein